MSKTDLSLRVFTRAAANALSPHPKTTWFHMAAHEFDNLGFRQPRLREDIVKRGFVIPRHSHNFRRCERAVVRARLCGDKIIGKVSLGHRIYTCETPAGRWNSLPGFDRYGQQGE